MRVRKARKKSVRLVERTRNGLLQEVINPRGNKAPVYIFQGSKPGFSAKYVKSHKNIPGSHRNAEAYARRLAKRGHRKVFFRD